LRGRRERSTRSDSGCGDSCQEVRAASPFRRLGRLVHPSPALVVALLALVLSVAGNAAAAVVIITSNSQVAKNTISGHQPPTGDQVNVIAGSINGTDVADNSLTGADIKESSLAGVAHKLFFFKSPSYDASTQKLIALGPWTMSARCFISSPSLIEGQLFVDGPGEAQEGFFLSADDGSAISHSAGAGLVPGTETEVVRSFAQNGHFGRAWGAVMLRSSTTVAQLEVHAVADFRQGLNHCFLYGTATLGV
jgi:hypothetical protein